MSEEQDDEATRLPRPLPPLDDSDEITTGADAAYFNRKALWSVVMGVALIFPSVSLGLLAGLVAITSATHARREIRLSRGQQRGDSLAQIGLAIGALLLIKSALLFGLNSR